jgi:hypothetical protein
VLDKQSRIESNDDKKMHPFLGDFGDNDVLGKFVFIPEQREILTSDKNEN